MRIIEYNDVDPLKAMYLTQLALGFALTPETAVRIRQTDPRPFPCLALYAVEDNNVLGQVGIYRLPMISTRGREDVGGVWALSTHPQYAESGVASRLLDEAHVRMREAGLRFSTLGTDRHRAAYKFFRRHHYEETHIWATALAPWNVAHQPTRLRIQASDSGGYDFIDQIFKDIARSYLGFAWRHTPFARLRTVDLADIWILMENDCQVGYVIAHADDTMLSITNLMTQPGIDTAEAVAAVASNLKSTYVHVKISRPVEMASLKRAGYHVVNPTWDGFMIKPLMPEVTVEDAWNLYGIGTDRFLISWLDVT